ncbi:class I SAM-dependent methyltransferase [Edaphobacter albus]|uniref:class I SAM-dependent methyltransferase n=1 Tax=Edaphobacter sp. 4G125 TaxID=2763071 RepID=UPI0016462448|nr:class I SAM-dependent methyltransferase [Edaphobacter sp. 4G125]QNI37634.1 class I SAM-dependent methyltransferase [Edaphobacter sp. 4G125]
MKEKNVGRFSGKATAYARYRERYAPEVLLPRLRVWCELIPEWTVADVGAGTGMLSDVFLENGNRVLAIEPNEEMRQMCADLHGDDLRLEIVDGTAEATGLAASSVEMVVAGRALHWFDLDRAMVEFRRVLKPEGWFASIAFGRRESGREENEAFEHLLRMYTKDHASTRATYQAYRRLEDFLVRDYRHEEIVGSMELDWDGLYGMAMSISHSPRIDDPGYVQFEQSLRAYFNRYAVGGVVTWETRYWINVGRLSA